MSGTWPIEPAPARSRGSTWAWAGVLLLAALLPATVLGLAGPLRWALPAALAAAGVAGLVAGAPVVAASSLVVLLPLPELWKVFAYEIALVLVAGALAIHGLKRRAPWLWRLDRIEVAVGVLLLWAVLTLIWSTSLWWGLFGVRKL